MDIDPASTAEPTDKLERAVKLIRSLEWSGSRYDEACCPSCDATKFHFYRQAGQRLPGKHKSDCKLVEFL